MRRRETREKNFGQNSHFFKLIFLEEAMEA
jgi:hypothetical protein